MVSQESELCAHFDNSFRKWVKIACQEWGYIEPSEDYFSRVKQRLPDGLRALLGYGLKSRLVIEKGRTFTLEGLPPFKGPYTWFSHNRPPKPAPNWEYFVQVAEFINFRQMASINHDMSVNFEDDLMDIGIYRNNKLFICCEIKEKVEKILTLIEEMSKVQSNVDIREPDRGKDPLRKAKYLITHRPEYFIVSAIGVRLEYKVIYQGDKSFELVRDIVPLV